MESAVTALPRPPGLVRGSCRVISPAILGGGGLALRAAPL